MHNAQRPAAVGTNKMSKIKSNVMQPGRRGISLWVDELNSFSPAAVDLKFIVIKPAMSWPTKIQDDSNSLEQRRRLSLLHGWEFEGEWTELFLMKKARA